MSGQRYDVILADPPWAFSAWSGKDSRTADAHYRTMTVEEICALDGWLSGHTRPVSALFLWATCSGLPDAFRVMASWGYTFKTVAFVWVKLNRKPLDDRELHYAVARLPADKLDRNLITYRRQAYGLHTGMGHYTRAGAELLLLGTRGRLKRHDAGVHQVVHAPLREHSQKPDEVYGLIERLYPNTRRLELFARARWPGWDAWGDEVPTP